MKNVNELFELKNKYLSTRKIEGAYCLLTNGNVIYRFSTIEKLKDVLINNYDESLIKE